MTNTKTKGSDPDAKSPYGGISGLVRRYGYFILYYLRSLVGKRGPLLGGIKLTHDCNLKCIHCIFWRKKGPSLSFEQAVASMRELHRMGVRMVIFEGGEPFLWRDGEHGLDDVVREAKDLFFSVGITTNGTFPIESSADTVWVSIDGLRETHDRIRGKTFDRAISNIEASSHPRIYAHITINSLNCDEVPELVEFLAPRAKGITIQFHYPYDELEDDLFLPWDRRREVLSRLIDLKRRGLPVSDSYACLEALKDNKWRCRPWMIASVDPDGKVIHGCYVKGRGEVSCERCGFSAHTEISLAYGGVLQSILVGNKVFGRR